MGTQSDIHYYVLPPHLRKVHCFYEQCPIFFTKIGYRFLILWSNPHSKSNIIGQWLMHTIQHRLITGSQFLATRDSNYTAQFLFAGCTRSCTFSRRPGHSKPFAEAQMDHIEHWIDMLTGCKGWSYCSFYRWWADFQQCSGRAETQTGLEDGLWKFCLELNESLLLFLI